MFSGLPGRTTNDDDRVLDDAVVLVLVPVVGDHAGIDQAGHVGLEREVDDVGRLAGLDRARLVARGAERVRELDALAVGGLVEAGLEILGVGLLGSRVGDQVDRAAAAVAGRGVDEPPQAATPRASAPESAAAASSRAPPRGRASATVAFAAPPRRGFERKRVMR